MDLDMLVADADPVRRRELDRADSAAAERLYHRITGWEPTRRHLGGWWLAGGPARRVLGGWSASRRPGPQAAVVGCAGRRRGPGRGSRRGRRAGQAGCPARRGWPAAGDCCAGRSGGARGARGRGGPAAWPGSVSVRQRGRGQGTRRRAGLRRRADDRTGLGGGGRLGPADRPLPRPVRQAGLRSGLPEGWAVLAAVRLRPGWVAAHRSGGAAARDRAAVREREVAAQRHVRLRRYLPQRGLTPDPARRAVPGHRITARRAEPRSSNGPPGTIGPGHRAGDRRDPR